MHFARALALVMAVAGCENRTPRTVVSPVLDAGTDVGPPSSGLGDAQIFGDAPSTPPPLDGSLPPIDAF